MLEGKVAVVTGGTRGIGFATVRKFLQNKAKVVLFGSRSETVEEAMNKLRAENASYEVMGLYPDISDLKAVEEAMKKVVEEYGRIDVLINNAGISHIGLLQDMTEVEWNRILSVNLSSIFYCSKLCIPSMLQKNSGKIINISSVWGVCGASCEVAYSASKSGIHGFTKALSKELAPSNIQVNAIACGAIETEMNHFLSSEEKTALIEEIPSNRFGHPEEVAHLVLQLVDNNNYLTGQIIQLDGGWI